MKRVITAAINKKAALEALLQYENTIFQAPMYHGEINQKLNQVDIYDSNNNLVMEVRPDEAPTTVERYRFVEATEEDILSGKKLYVREKYTSNTTEQLGQPASHVSVSQILRR